MLPGRERLRRVLAMAGDPHLAVPSVLVGGTNGKGRAVAGLSAALSTNHRTGAFIKPHLASIRERWRINDRDVEEDMLEGAVEKALGLIEESGEEISFFEANVLIGALLFRDAGCELAVWEVGLGGKEDACNLVDPMLSILTSVGYDHMHILGDTLAEIATDKAHIAREGRTLLLGPPRPGWEKAYAEYAPVVQRVAGEIDANIKPLAPPPDEMWHDYVVAAFTGAIPPDSAAIIAAAADELAEHGFRADLVRINHVRYPARMERRQLAGHEVLLDAAHNVDSLRWLRRVLDAHNPGGGFPLIFGCQATRDPAEMLGELKGVVSSVTPVSIPVLRPCPVPPIIAAAESLGMPVELPPGFEVRDTAAALDIGHVTELDEPDDSTGWIECVRHGVSLGNAAAPTVICGSIYYLGEILRVLDR